MGELHLEIIHDRLKREFKIECSTGTVEIAYRQTITKGTEKSFHYVNKVGQQNYDASLTLIVEPTARGTGNKIRVDLNPHLCPIGMEPMMEMIPFITNGIESYFKRGTTSLGFPMEDVCVTISGGFYNIKNKKNMNQSAYNACSFKLMDMILDVSPEDESFMILEPLMDLEVMVDNSLMGMVSQDIGNRRGTIKKIDFENNENIISASVPLSNLIGYSTSLRKMTRVIENF
jgi:elongation factor G